MAIVQVLLSSVLNHWQKISIDIQDNITGNWTETCMNAGLNGLRSPPVIDKSWFCSSLEV